MTSTESDLVFVDALPGREIKSRTGSRTISRAADLRTQPGRWAHWPSTAGRAWTLGTLVLQGAGFETCEREIDGKVLTFARFVSATPASSGPPPSSSERFDGIRPRVRCPGCTDYVTVEEGETPRNALWRHGEDSDTCGSIIARQAMRR